MYKKVKKIMALGLTIAMCVSNIGVARAQETTTETGESSNQAEEAVVDRKSTRLNSSHNNQSRMPSSA